MCGIIVSITSGGSPESILSPLTPYISSRGPDSIQTHTIHLPLVHSTSQTTNLTVTFTSSVLHLRGPEITVQPLISQSGNILCWNGEIWKGIPIQDSENDGLKLLQELERRNDKVWKVMERIEGPWAMVYYEAETKKIWFGRDCLGRRSLLQRDLNGEGMVLSSVGSIMEGWEEVGVEGLWYLDLHDWVENMKTKPNLHPWVWKDEAPQQEGVMVRPYPPMNRTLPGDEDKDIQTPSQFLEILRAAISIRTRTIPQTHTYLHQNRHEVTPRVAILYSGGLDCSVIAWLIHKLLPPEEPVDLINVAFENPRTLHTLKVPKEEIYNVCPDRITGRAGWEELQILSKESNRHWRFIEVDIPYEETLSKRDDILKLMYPNNSVMDMSIAMAFYFAARGQGSQVHPDGSRSIYITPAKVFFSGLGADEQLGGYSRHAMAWKRSKGDWNAIIQELDHDLARLPYRNLGRDDRIISNFGREVRYPFLDEGVVRFLSSLRADQKISPWDPQTTNAATLAEGEVFGNKTLLRRVAMMVGLERAAREKKRAVQFGSRSAKMEIGVKLKGQDEVN